MLIKEFSMPWQLIANIALPNLEDGGALCVNVPKLIQAVLEKAQYLIDLNWFWLKDVEDWDRTTFS